VRLLGALCIGLAMAWQPTSAATLFSRDGHEIIVDGYMRAGVGASLNAPVQSCFWAPGAAWKYRLGNECDNYLSISGFGKLALWDNPFLDYVGYGYKTAFSGAYGESIEGGHPIMNYVEFGDIAGTSAKAWIGRREILLQDIYITDYYYMNVQGDGFGVYDVPLGSVQFSYSYLREELYDADNTGTVYQHNHDFGITGIETNPGGTLALDVRLSRIFDDDTGTTGIHDTRGWAVALRHSQENLWGGSNDLIVQYGRGVARSAFAYAREPYWVGEKLLSPQSSDDLEDARTARLLNSYFYDGDRWAMMGLVLFEYKKSRDFDAVDQAWFSVGARPTWFLGDHWRLTGELGLDYIVDWNDQSEGYLLKQTLALEWAPERGFFSRPTFRAYVTRADWSQTFQGQVGWPHHIDTTQAWGAGLQVEYWW